ncbi:MAG: glycosyltransferase family 4 protein [Planctomycetota bacterium]
MKKIVQIVSGYKQRDGIGNVAVARAQALIALGCQVTVICHETEDAQRREPAPAFHVIPFGHAGHHTLLPEAVRRATVDADVAIFDVGGHSPLQSLAELRRGNNLIDYHGMTPPELIRDPGYAVEWHRGVKLLRELRGCFDLLIAHSRFTLGEWRRTIGPEPAAAEIVPLFGATAPLPAPELLPLTGRRPRLLMVGRMFPNKNYEVAIQAVAALRRRGIDVELSHIGGGSDVVSTAYRRTLQGLIDGLHLADRVTLRGARPQSELEAAYRGCDALVLASLHEGFALPAVEALACGKPVFASELGALPETVAGGGMFFNPFDADDLAARIEGWLGQDVGAHRATADAALARARELTRETCVKRFIDLILRAEPRLHAPPTPASQRLPGAALEIELPENFTARLPHVQGVARVKGWDGPALPATVGLTVHLIDDGGQILQYDERPEQTARAEAAEPTLDFQLILARSERPHHAIFQLVDTAPDRPVLFGRPFVLRLAPRLAPARPLDRAQQMLQAMRPLGEVRFGLEYPGDTLTQRLKSYIAQNLTARLRGRLIQPHMDLQGDLNEQFIELLGLLLRHFDEKDE